MKKPLILAALCGLLAALFTGLYLTSLENRYKKGAESVKVLVARQYIDQGTMLDTESVEERAVPKAYLQPKALRVLKELTGSDGRKIFMATAPIEKGEQIMTTKLSMLGMDTGISAVIPSAHRSVTLTFNSELVNGIVKPGNRVDIIGIFQYEDKGNQVQETAITVLQNILVLAVGDTVLGAFTPAATTADGRQQASDFADSGSVPLSLCVTPAEAEALTLSAERGNIRFALRPTGDENTYPSSGTRIKDLCRDISSTVKSAENNQAASSVAYAQEIQKKQKEVLELLKKYKGN